jgi:hypothetical protein
VRRLALFLMACVFVVLAVVAIPGVGWLWLMDAVDRRWA